MERGMRHSSVSAALKTCRAELAADLAVNRFPAARLTCAIWRAGMSLNGVPGPAAFALRRAVQLADLLWVRGVIGAELPTQVRVGPGLRLPHGGRGVIVHSSVSIGARACLYHRTTIGVRNGDIGPRLGDDVYLGTGAVVIGDIDVATGTRVGANAVLMSSTEGGGTYVGVPAQRAGSAARPR